MGSPAKLIIVLLLSYLFAIEGKAISKRYVEHLLRDGYASDCGDTAYSAPSPLPTIIAARAELSPLYAEPTASLPFGYEYTAPIPPPTLTIETGKDCGQSALIAAADSTPVELPAPATAITTDCNDIPTLPLAPPPTPEYSIIPPPAELPLPPPAELPITDHEGPIIAEPSKIEDCGIEVAAAPAFDAFPSAPQLIELPPPPAPLTIEAPALPEQDEGCGGTPTTYAAPFTYGIPESYLGHHLSEEAAEFYAQRNADYLYGRKLLPSFYEQKALAGFRYGMPQLTDGYWGSPLKMRLMKRKPLLIRTGISHPILSTGLEGYHGKILAGEHPALQRNNLIHFMNTEWRLPMYRTGVSHPFLDAKAKK